MPARDTFINRFSYAVTSLATSDTVLSGIIESVGACTLGKKENYYLSLIGAVINQQLSGFAADSIFRGFSRELGGDITPEKVLRLSHEQFRRSGISKSKESYIRGISEKFVLNKRFLSDLVSKTDSEVLSHLTDMRGVGMWTAQMFMIFSLNRLDVLPIRDAGLRRGISKFYLEGGQVADHDILRISENWKPYRSIAVWYIWMGIDGTPKGPIQV